MKGLLLAVSVLLVAGCGDSTATAAPLDVKAAQGCEASFHMLQDLAASKTAQVNADEAKLQPIAAALLAGTAEAQAAGKPAPKWAALGANLTQAMADANTGDITAFGKDQDAITPDCNKIPDAAKVAGGFTK